MSRAPGTGHFGTLTISLDQGSSDTKLSLSKRFCGSIISTELWTELDGVPLGKEEETERNLGGWRSLF
jgi:hypothetical protein